MLRGIGVFLIMLAKTSTVVDRFLKLYRQDDQSKRRFGVALAMTILSRYAITEW